MDSERRFVPVKVQGVRVKGGHSQLPWERTDVNPVKVVSSWGGSGDGDDGGAAHDGSLVETVNLDDVRDSVFQILQDVPAARTGEIM